MPTKTELSLVASFEQSTHIHIPKWLSGAGKAVQCFYSTMKLWDNLCQQVKDLEFPHQIGKIFPVLKKHVNHFTSIVGFCEVRPEMLTMLKTALIGITYGCMEENKEELSVFRYNYALDTTFDLLIVPQSQRCRRPEYVTEDGQVERALCSTAEKIFGIVLNQMKSEGRKNDYIDYLIYACVHFSHPDSGYSRAGRKAICNAFKDFYIKMHPDERNLVPLSKFYQQNPATKALIDEMITDAISNAAQPEHPRVVHIR